MNKDACIVSGALVDAKNVGVHKSLRLIIDIPQEQAMEVIKKLGWPTMASPIPVAIARLNPENVKEVMPETPARTLDTSPASETTPARAKNRYAKKAGILCNDPAFWTYLADVQCIAFYGATTDKEKVDIAANFVRITCGVISRADILPNTRAATTFDMLENDFVLWRDADKFVEIA